MCGVVPGHVSIHQIAMGSIIYGNEQQVTNTVEEERGQTALVCRDLILKSVKKMDICIRAGLGCEAENVNPQDAQLGYF